MHNQNLTEVPSPTFNLINEYKIGSLLIKHCDLYRIIQSEELENIGIFEDIANQITLIEWPEILKPIKSQNTIELFFEYEDDYNKRILSISSNKNKKFLNEFK